MVTLEQKPTLLLTAPVASRSGYGNHSREIAIALIKSEKFILKIRPTGWGATPNNALEKENADHEEIRRCIVGDINSKPDICIQINIPSGFEQIGHINIGITAGIETTLCDPSWIEGCNKMDLIITTSNHSKQVFENSVFEKRDKNSNNVIGILKIEKPIKVLFEGLDTNVYSKKVIKSDLTNFLNKIDSDFAFLFVGHWLQGDFGEDRKDVSRLISSFFETFLRKMPKNQPALILKTSLASFSENEKFIINQKIDKIYQAVKEKFDVKNLPPVYLLHGDLLDSQMNELYNHPKVKAMVSFTKGEGFGKPLLEFSTTGKPVIASGWSGQLDFLNPKYSVLIPGKVEPVGKSAVNEWIIKESHWFNVDIPSAKLLLSDVYNNYDSYLKISKEQGKISRENFTLEKMQTLLIDYIESAQNISTSQIKSFNLPKLIKK
jgi:glycosyltransferase involved in cell wall biosynthesis